MAINANAQSQNIHRPVLKVLGLGGGGGNAVNRMIELGIKGVDFIAANTDHQDLAANLAPTKIMLGPKLTRGLGAGGDPKIGYAAAQESAPEIRAALEGADMVFLAAGMGGGTGTGAIQVAGKIAKEIGAVTIAVVTTPFAFEMGRRQQNAQDGLAALRPNTNTLIAIPNDRLLYAWPQDISLETAFRLADDVLRQAVQGISELVTAPGVINVDFAHIRSVMKLGGGALMAIGQGSGEGKAMAAVNQALNHPLLESICLSNAAGIIINFTGGKDLTLFDVGEALAHIHSLSRPDVDVIMGFDNDDRLNDRVQVILVITGLGAQTLEEILPGSEKRIKEEPVAPPRKNVETLPLGEQIPPPTPGIMVERESLNLASVPVDNQLATGDLDLPAFMRRRVRYNND
jgi:cell division protein FtsZ